MVMGAALRRLRETRGLSHEQASRAIHAPETTISGAELGRAGLRLRDVAELCTLYGVTDHAERITLLGLARQANRPEWWQSYLDLLPGWFARYLGLEQAASLIRSYEVQFIPGLLQTAGYARAVIGLSYGDAPAAEIERRVELRLRRQDVLRRLWPPHLWAVVDEAALRRPMGSRATMREQLRHLIAACDLPHVTLWALPFRLGGHPAAGGPITVLRMPDGQLPDVVYLEQLTSARYCDDPGECEFYRHILNQLVIKAQPAGSAQAILSEILRET
jgi:hypothetical protein